MSDSLISVIVPVFNIEAYIGRCINSILNQTFNDYDIILVDDGSTDASAMICDSYQIDDSRIHIIHQRNQGLSSARNAGIDWAFNYSKSLYITFVDGDDWIHPDYLKELYLGLRKFDTDISICDYIRVYDVENVNNDSCPLPLSQSIVKNVEACKNAFMISDGCYNNAPGKLFRKSLFKNKYFPVGKINEDIFIIPQILYEAKSITKINFVGYYYYQRNNSIQHCKYSEKNWDEIEGISEAISYFENRNEFDISFQAKWYLLHILIYHFMDNKKDFGSKDVSRRIRLMFNRTFDSERRKIVFSKDKDLYFFRYPLLLKLYRILMKIGIINIM